MALILKPDWFLTDDAAARLMAESLAVEAHGSLGVILWTATNRLVRLDEAQVHFAALENSSLWMSRHVRSEPGRRWPGFKAPTDFGSRLTVAAPLRGYGSRPTGAGEPPALQTLRDLAADLAMTAASKAHQSNDVAIRERW